MCVYLTVPSYCILGRPLSASHQAQLMPHFSAASVVCVAHKQGLTSASNYSTTMNACVAALQAVGTPYSGTPPDLCQPAQLGLLQPAQMESLALLHLMLHFISYVRVRRMPFSWWFQVVTTRVLNILFPNALPGTEDGFRVCPFPIMGLLLDWVYGLQQVSLWRDIISQLGADTPSMRVWLEMLKQGMAMPALYAPVIDRLVLCYDAWVQGVNLPLDASQAVSKFVPQFLSHTFAILYMEVDARDRDKMHAKLYVCQRVVAIYRIMAQQSWLRLTEAIWESLLVTVLNGCNYLINTDETRDQRVFAELTHPLLRVRFTLTLVLHAYMSVCMNVCLYS
jgi:hypothetical protein